MKRCCVCKLLFSSDTGSIKGFGSHMKYHERKGEAVKIDGYWRKVEMVSKRAQ